MRRVRAPRASRRLRHWRRGKLRAAVRLPRESCRAAQRGPLGKACRNQRGESCAVVRRERGGGRATPLLGKARVGRAAHRGRLGGSQDGRVRRSCQRGKLRAVVRLPREGCRAAQRGPLGKACRDQRGESCAAVRLDRGGGRAAPLLGKARVGRAAQRGRLGRARGGRVRRSCQRG